MKKILIALFFFPFFLSAQFVDDFSDGDFLLNPSWFGDDSLYAVNSNALQLNATVPKTAYLYTSNSLMDSTEWKFYIKMEFSPSSTSYARVYLASNSSNFVGSLNGYYLQFGEANSTDVIRLFRQSGATSTLVCSGTTNISASVNINVKVTRRGNGNWSLYTAPFGSNTYSLEATGVDNTYTTTSFFGIYSKFSTSTYNKKFYYDDFSVNYLEADITAPSISSINAVSDSVLELVFSEFVNKTSSEIDTNYTVDGGILHPDSAIRDALDFSKVKLYFSNHFLSGQTYTLTVDSVKDLSNNAITAGSTANFTWIAPVIIEKFDLVFNEIFADPSPQIGLPANEFIEIYNRSSKIINLNGCKYSDGTSLSVLSNKLIQPNTYLILCSVNDTANYKVFGNVLGISPWPSLNNAGDNITLKTSNDLLIDNLSYTDTWYNDDIKKDGGWTLEKIRFNDTCALIGNWNASINVQGGTPGVQNSIFIGSDDVTGPKVLSSKVTSINTVELSFDETIDFSTATISSNYLIDHSIGAVSQATLGGTYANLVELSLPLNLDTGVVYKCLISGVKDCKGNQRLTPDTIEFVVYHRPKPFDVVFNEIMADPEPVVDLPNCEYLELVNRRNYPINLKSWNLKLGTTMKVLPDFRLNAGEHVLICPTANQLEFGSQIKSIGLSTISLTNSGMDLSLHDSTGLEISRITYSDNWYNDPEKKNGGWSLECINYNDTCSMFNHWTESVNAMGGTPGLNNSLSSFPADIVGPIPVSVDVISSTSIIANFDESIDTIGISNVLQYAIGPSNGILSTSIYGANRNRILINLQLPIDTGVLYTVRFINIKDCKGNLISTLDSLQFMIYHPAKKHDIIINEIMADPDPIVGLPSCEYVELYSRRTEPISLKNWRLSAGTSIKLLPDFILQPNTYVLICLSTCAASFDSGIKKIGLSTFPSLTNSGMLITLKDSTNKIISSVNYSDSWYNDAVKKNGGWSLELVNPEDTCSFLNNWAASDDYNGGTPGLINNVYSLMPDLNGPVILESRVLSDTTILVTFNETLDTVIASMPGNYNISLIGNPKFVSCLPPFYDRVLITMANKVDSGVVYSCKFNNIRDCKGNFIVGIDSIRFALYFKPKPFDVIINEIMADPDPIVSLPNSEFIEFYNRRNYIVSLYKWKLVAGTSTKTLPDIVIPANSFAIICSEVSLQEFPSSINKYSIPSFPSLTNSGMPLTLKDSSNRIISEVYYSDKWYNNEEKDDGGWSLELINPNDTCSALNNWNVAQNSLGGTPGQINSVFSNVSDVVGPKLTKLSVISNVQLYAEFNETLDDISTSVNNFNIDNGIGTPASVIINGVYKNSMIITLSIPIDTGTIYHCSFSGIADCKGNPMSDLTGVEFAIYKKAKPYTIVINEIMADPEPLVHLPSCEYIELYNKNNFSVNLKSWKLLSGTTAKLIPEVIIPANSYLLLTSQDCLQLFSNSISKFGMSSFISLANSGQTVTLLDSLGNLISTITYSDSWYNNVYKKNGGWSLEQIDYNNPCGGYSNWTASNNSDGGTPGQQNSVLALNADNVLPEILRIGYVDTNAVRVYFTEPMDSMSLKSLQAYSVSPDLGNPNAIKLITPDFSSVLLSFNQKFKEGIIYTLSVNQNLFDCVGNIIQSSITARFSKPENPDVSTILINELLSYAYDGGTDFVEIYNNSNKVFDLRDLTIASKDTTGAKDISNTSYLMFPQDYIVLCKDPQLVSKFYTIENPKNMLAVSSFPAFSSTEGSVILSTKAGSIIDQFDYNDKMHHPLLNSTKGVSLERLSFEIGTSEKTNWHSASQTAKFATPTYKNSQYIDIIATEGTIEIIPELFSPDNDGYDDVVTINYKFENPGNTANVVIYDSRGRLIKVLAKNKIIPSQGLFIWDGLNEDNIKVPVGIYVLYFEAFNVSGNISKFKKTIVVATKF